MADSRGRFRPSDRVRKRSEFRAFQGSRWKVVSPGFVFLLGYDATGVTPRLGITASRRVGCAVVRNRAKRLVREAFRLERSHWPRQLVTVVIVRRSPGTRRLGDIHAEWKSCRGRLAKLWPKVVDAARSEKTHARAER